MKQSNIVTVLKKRMESYKKGAATTNAKMSTPRPDPSNGFKAVIDKLTYRQLINLSVKNARNLTPKERAYVNNAMTRRRQMM